VVILTSLNRVIACARWQTRHLDPSRFGAILLDHDSLRTTMLLEQYGR
jgi:hypothetical protein